MRLLTIILLIAGIVLILIGIIIMVLWSIYCVHKWKTGIVVVNIFCYVQYHVTLCSRLLR